MLFSYSYLASSDYKYYKSNRWIDGLAAGVVAIASLCIAYVAYIFGYYLGVFPMLAIAGGALGFLPYNFYPAKTFMGDCGSHNI